MAHTMRNPVPRWDSHRAQRLVAALALGAALALVLSPTRRYAKPSAAVAGVHRMWLRVPVLGVAAFVLLALPSHSAQTPPHSRSVAQLPTASELVGQVE